MKLHEGNKYVQKLKQYIKTKFNHCHTYLYKYIIENGSNIINKGDIPVSIITDEKHYEKFIKYNNRRTEDDDYNNKFILKDHASVIIQLLKKYHKSLSIPEIGENSFSNKYVQAKEFTEEYYPNNVHLIEDFNTILPTEETTWQSLLRNLFYNNEVNYAFNHEIETTQTPETAQEIKTTTFKIRSSGEDVELPTKYKWQCKAKTKHGECGNIVEFYNGHLHNTIKCNLNHPDDEEAGHTIKNPDNIPPYSVRKLYCYYLNIYDGDSDKEYLAYSLLPIEKEIITANYVYITDDKSFIMLLGYKYEDEKDSNVEFFSKDNITLNQKWFWVDDVFKSIQRYYKEHHDINITNQNRFVAYCIIIQSMCNILFGRRYHGMYIGKSGSGKTFWSEYLVPMFTFNYKQVLGNSVTKNRFIGGRSNVISQFKNSLYEPGYIETKDLLVVDECTEPLDNMYNPKLPSMENIYTWIKVADQNIDRGIQGSREAKPHASIILFGNTEQLKTIRSEYIKQLRKAYVRSTSGKTLQQINTIYRQPQYYIDVYENESLAKSHAVTREDYYKHHHYITGLPEAEMSRYTFFICLEDDEYGFSRKQYTGFKLPKINIHRKEFLEEIKKKFENVENKPPEEFNMAVWNYLNDKLQNDRNNYRFTKEKDVNRHIFNNLASMLCDVLYLNKLWYGEVVEFVKEDKLIVDYLLQHNHNILNRFECSGVKQPRINDIYFPVEEIRQQVEDEKTKYKKMLSDSNNMEIDEPEQQPQKDEVFGMISDDEFEGN